MLRLWLQGAALSALVFCALLGVMHAAPYDDRGLRAALFSSDCAPPCFLGIRPGVTTREESLALLQTHPWVGSVSLRSNGEVLTWRWNGSQPAFLRAGRFENNVIFEGEVVGRIDLLTWTDAATFTIMFGAPDELYYASWRVRDDVTNQYVHVYQQNALFEDEQFEFQMAVFCPLSIYRQWLQPTALSIPARSVRLNSTPLTNRTGARLRQECQ